MRLLLASLLGLLISAQALALKPEHEADRLLLAAKNAVEAAQYHRAGGYLEQARALKIELPADYYYLLGRVEQSANNYRDARQALETYIDTAGRDGDYYTEALQAITDIDERAGDDHPATEQPVAELQWSGKPAANKSAQAEARAPINAYIKGLMELYDSQDPIDALTLHINTLLELYAYHDPRLIAASRRGPETRHHIATNKRGEILSSRIDDDNRADSDRFSVYGVDPYIDSRCQRATNSCWLLHPVSKRKWLQIVDNKRGLDDLKQALAQLIKAMQKR